jgi:hypothetical protein
LKVFDNVTSLRLTNASGRNGCTGEFSMPISQELRAWKQVGHCCSYLLHKHSFNTTHAAHIIHTVRVNLAEFDRLTFDA